MYEICIIPCKQTLTKHCAFAIKLIKPINAFTAAQKSRQQIFAQCNATNRAKNATTTNTRMRNAFNKSVAKAAKTNKQQTSSK